MEIIQGAAKIEFIRFGKFNEVSFLQSLILECFEKCGGIGPTSF